MDEWDEFESENTEFESGKSNPVDPRVNEEKVAGECACDIIALDGKTKESVGSCCPESQMKNEQSSKFECQCEFGQSR